MPRQTGFAAAIHVFGLVGDGRDSVTTGEQLPDQLRPERLTGRGEARTLPRQARLSARQLWAFDAAGIPADLPQGQDAVVAVDSAGGGGG